MSANFVSRFRAGIARLRSATHPHDACWRVADGATIIRLDGAIFGHPAAELVDAGGQGDVCFQMLPVWQRATVHVALG
jgi:hypothetical protein